MKKIFTFLLFALWLTGLSAQPNIGGRPMSEQLEKEGMITPLALLSVHTLPELDMKKVYADQKNGLIANQFAVGVAVNLGLQNAGLWEELPNGDRIWRMALRSKDAIALISLYKEFFLPVGATFYIYNDNRSVVFGGFTSANNPKDPSWGYSTAMIAGEVTVYEYFEPRLVKGQGRLFLDFVSHVFAPDMSQDPEIERQKRDRQFSGQGFGDANLPCAINVNCSSDLGKDWQKEKRGVARISLIQRNGGAGWCSGSLINNTALDEKPLFYSANHCVGDVDYGRVQYHFNYESPSCSNLEPTKFDMVVGSRLLMTSRDADTWLVELSSLPPNPFFIGWSREDVSPGVGIGISHPNGDIKKIHRHSSAVSNSTPIFVNNGSGGSNQFPINSHWTTIVTKGYLAPGSSGSALLSENDRLIYGTLHSGGPFDCTPNNIRANYGKLSWAWNNGSSASQRLRDWLDPIGRNVTQLPSLEPGENNQNVIISEIAQGRIGNREIRFIELFNANPDRKINLNALSLVRLIDGNPNNTKTIVLRSNFELLPLKTFVIANAAFDASWGLPPHDFISTELGDGNDTYQLLNVGANLYDNYGEKGLSGTGRFWDYAGKTVHRRPHIFRPNGGNFSQISFNEWEVKDFSLQNISPGTHSVVPPQKDLMITEIIEPTENSAICDGKISPTVRLFNNGKDSIAAFRLKVWVGEQNATINSKVGIGVGKSQVIDFSTEDGLFQASAGSEITLKAKSEMIGDQDDVPVNDSVSITIKLSGKISKAIIVELKTDDFPEQTSWEIYSTANQILYSQDYTGFEKRKVYKSRICLDTSICYTFRIKDKASNGISSQGYFKIYSEKDNIALIDPSNFSAFRNFDLCNIERPAAPTQCEASVRFGNIVGFSWRDNSFIESGFQVQRQFPALSFGIWEEIQNLGINQTKYDDILSNSQARNKVIYRVRAFRDAPNGVRVYSTYCEMNDEILSLQETQSQWVEVYPNPSSGLLNLKFNQTQTQAFVYEIVELTGRQVKMGTLSQNDSVLDLSALPKGIYILKLSAQSQSSVLKIVLE